MKEHTRRNLLLLTSLMVPTTISTVNSQAMAAGEHGYNRFLENRSTREPNANTANRIPQTLLPRLPREIPTHARLAGTVPVRVVPSRLPQRLDLASAKPTVKLTERLLQDNAQLSIELDGSLKSFVQGTKVTVAEYVALKQVQETGLQTIALDEKGTAVGGSFSLNSVLTSRVSKLVIPEKVSAVGDVSSDNQIGVKGTIQNFGAIYGISTNSQTDSGTIFAKSIRNESTGIVSTDLPDWLVSKSPDVISSVDLTLQARKDITNHGVISSSGDLKIATVYGAIKNTQFDQSLVSPMLQADHDLNLQAGNGVIVNSGKAISINGNINVSALDADTSLRVNGETGSFNASHGEINVRDSNYNGSSDISLNGGDYHSNNLNLYSGTGVIESKVGEISGYVNTAAGIDHIFAHSKTLYLGKNCVTGDPTYVNTGGDIVIAGQTSVSGDLAILASGNITADAAGEIRTNGKNLIMVAGAGITIGGSGTGGNNTPSVPLNSASALDDTQTAIVDFTSGTGGNIDLTSSMVTKVIDASSTVTAGGNVTLAAVSQAMNGGFVLLSTSSVIDTTGALSDGIGQLGGRPGGNVSIFAGAAPAIGKTTIQLGGIVAPSGAGQSTAVGGAIVIATTAPKATVGNTVTFNTAGQIVSGGPIIGSGSMGSKAQVLVAGDIITSAAGQQNVGSLTITDDGHAAGPVSIMSDGDLSTQNILAFGQGGMGGFGSVGGNGGNGAPVTLISNSGSITVTGMVNTAGGGGGGGWGRRFPAAPGFKGGAGGKGGDIIIQAVGAVSVTGNVVATAGGAGGQGGDSTTAGSEGGGGGGGSSFGGGGGGGGGASFTSRNGGGGGNGFFGGGGGSDLGGTGGGTTGGFGISGGQTATSSTGGSGATGAPAGTGGPGFNGGGSGLSGKGIYDTNPGNADVTITGNGLSLPGQVLGENVTISTTPGSNAGIAIGQNINGLNSLTIQADGSGDITFEPTFFSMGFMSKNVSLSTGTGNIGLSANPIKMHLPITLKANTAGNVFLDLGASFNTHLLNSSAGNGKTFEITADLTSLPLFLDGDVKATSGTIGLIKIAYPIGFFDGGLQYVSGTLIASKVDLSSPGSGGAGNLGSAKAPIQVNAQELSINTLRDAYINSTGGPVTLRDSSAFDLNLTNNVGIITGGDVIAESHLRLFTPALTVTSGDKLQGNTVEIYGPSGSDLTVDNQGQIIAKFQVIAQSSPSAGIGGNLFIDGGGSIVAAKYTIDLIAETSGTLNNRIEFLGSQTLIGTTTLNAAGSNQSIVVDAGAHIAGDSSVIVNSPTLLLNGGTLTGSPLIINPQRGTIASTGPLDLSSFGSLAFSGLNLAILSAGDITDNGTNTTISLLNPFAKSGSLTILAGFNFTPSTVGATGPDQTLYTIDSSASGSIDLGNTTIQTSGADIGGDVVAIANGSVTLGSITTAGGTGASGSVRIIGNGVTVNGYINTTNKLIGNSGDVTIFAGSTALSGPVLVQNGSITSGTISSGAANGSISLAGILASDKSVLLTAGGTIESSAPITADTLNMTAPGGIGTLNSIHTDAKFITANAGAGDVSLVLFSGGATSLTGNNSASKFEVIAVGTLNIDSTISAIDLNLSAGKIFFASNTLAAVQRSNGDGGSLTLSANSIDWSTSATKALALNADGTGTGIGGTISVNVQSALSVGSTAGDFQFSAVGSTSGGQINIEGSTLKIDNSAIAFGPLSPNGDGGKLSLEANSISNVAAGALILNASGKGSGNGGSLSVKTHIGGLSIGSGAGDIQLTATSGASGGNGGKIAVSAAGDLTINATALNVGPLGASGNGGTISLSGSKVINAVPGNLVLNADGIGNGNGGSILIGTGAGNPITIGSGAGEVTLLARSGISGGNGGSVFVSAGGALNVDLNSIQVGPRGTSGDGGHLSFQGTSITWPTIATSSLNLDVSGKGTGSGGSVSVGLNGVIPIDFGTGAGDFFVNAQSGANGGNGGEVSVATQGNVHIDTSALLISPLGTNGNGGFISVMADSISYPNSGSTSLILDASGRGTGNGGNLSIVLSGPSSMIIGKATSQIQLIATSGTAGGNGGTVTFQSGGDLTVDATAVSVGALGKAGNGGNLDLEADGNLLINGNLSLNAKGKNGIGGIMLLRSNSATIFDVGSKSALNGVRGKLSVEGKPTHGTIIIRNDGGGVTNSDKLKAFFDLELLGTEVSIGGKIGDSQANSINLVATNGDIIADSKSSSLTASKLDLTAIGGTIGTSTSALQVSTSNFAAGSTGLLNIENKSKTDTLVKGTSLSNTFTLQSSSSLIVSGNIQGATSVELSSKGGISSNKLGNTIQAPTILLTAGAAGIGTGSRSIRVIGSDLTVDTKGSANIENVQLAALNLHGVTAKTFNLKSVGDINIVGTVGAKNSSVVLQAIGAANIIQGIGGSINGSSVSLVSEFSNIGTSLAPIQLNATSFETLAGGDVVVTDVATKGVTEMRNSFGKSLTITTGGATNINYLTALDGSILVTNSAGKLQTNPGAVLVATNGSITLRNNDIGKGSIILGANSNISTGGIGGDVTITIGAPVMNAGVTPGNVQVVQQGITGGVFFGASGITASSPLNTLNFKDANIIFSTPLSSKSIQLNGGVVITADPPNPLGVDVLPLQFPNRESLETSDGGHQTRSIRPLLSEQSIDRSTIDDIIPLGVSPLSVSVVSSDSLTRATTILESIRFTTNEQAAAWSSETELESGLVPANVVSDHDLAIDTDASPDAPIEGGKRELKLRSGSIVVLSRIPTNVRTPFGKVHIDSGSVVLVMCSQNGLSIYDIHDSHRNAVRFSTDNYFSTLAPGRHVSVTNSSSTFEDINPAQLFGYRAMTAREISNESKVFSSEFSIPQALSTVLPLDRLIKSDNPHAKKLTASVLKTTAVLMQLHGVDGTYEQYRRPSSVAWTTQ